MEQPKGAGGRPAKSAEKKKKSRSLSFTDAEYNRLLELAAAAGHPGQPSAFLIEKHRLNVPPKPKQP